MSQLKWITFSLLDSSEELLLSLTFLSTFSSHSSIHYQISPSQSPRPSLQNFSWICHLRKTSFSFLYCIPFQDNIPFNSSETKMLLSSTIQRRRTLSYFFCFFFLPSQGKRQYRPHFPFFSFILLPGEDDVISFHSWCVKRGCVPNQNPSLWPTSSTVFLCSISWYYIHSSHKALRQQNVQEFLNHSRSTVVKGIAIFCMLNNLSHP